MVPLRHFKGMVMGVLFLGAVMLSLIGALIFLYFNEVDEKNNLVRRSASHARETKAVTKEKDALMAQLAVAESKLKLIREEMEGEAPAVETEPAESAPTADVEAEARSDESQVQKPEPVTVPDSKAAEPPPAVKPPAAGVSVDSLLVCYDEGAGRMHVAFKIINVGEKKQPVSGYVYALFKGEGMESGDWLTHPTTRLQDGKPAQTKGMRFRIYNYRTMKFSAMHDDPHQYTHATIFVYQQDSAVLMLERDFEINMMSTCP